MKWTMAISTALLSLSAFSFTVTFKGTVDLSDSKYPSTSSYEGKIHVTMELSAETLQLTDTVAKKAYWGDVDVSEEDAYYCNTNMIFSPVKAKFTVTDEQENILLQETKTDVPKANHAFKINKNDDCEVTLPSQVSFDMKGLYHDYLKLALKAYPERTMTLMPIVLQAKGDLSQGSVSNISFGDQQLQWFINQDQRQAEPVGNIINLSEQ